MNSIRIFGNFEQINTHLFEYFIALSLTNLFHHSRSNPNPLTCKL